MSRHTSPPGYESNYAAILDLLRFGPGIWSCAQMLALLFHAERSTAYGKDADKHSEDQATGGIYSVPQLAWVRGPSGLSRASWYRANSELEIHPEDAKKTPLGVLRKNRNRGRYDVTEYEIDWRAVKAAISRWREIEGSQRETPQARSRGLSVRPQGSQRETPASTDSKGQIEIEGSQRETHSQSPTLKSDLDSRSDASLEAAINLELELACGERVRTDGPAKEILKAGRKLRIPAMEIVARIIHEKAGNFRARKYPFHPGLLAKTFCQEAIPWMRKNHLLVEECERRMQVESNRQSAVAEMQSPSVIEQQRLVPERKPDPKYGMDLVNEIKNRRARGANR